MKNIFLGFGKHIKRSPREMISIGMMNITYMCHGQVTLWIFHGVMAIPSEWIYPYGLMTTPKKMYFS